MADNRELVTKRTAHFTRAAAAPSWLPRAGDGWRRPWQFRRALRPCVPWMPEPRRAPPRPRRKQRYLVLSNWRRRPGHLGRDSVSRAPGRATSCVANSQAHRAPAFPPVLQWRRLLQLRLKMKAWSWEMGRRRGGDWGQEFGTTRRSSLQSLEANGCRLRRFESRCRSAKFLASPAKARAPVWCLLPNTRCATGLA